MTLKAVSDTQYDNKDKALSAVEAILTEGHTTAGKGILSVSKVERKAVANEPPLLYDLTTLQKEANRKHGFSADTTLSIAQSLCEKKLATYPRTGSRYISEDIFEEIPDLIKFAGDKFGYEKIADNLLSGELNRRRVDASKVTDHHALLITGNTPDSLSAEEDKIYRMILSRMLEAFSEASRKETMQVTLEAAGVTFSLKAETITHKGWRAILNEKQEDEENATDSLSNFTEGETVTAKEVYDTEHKTKPKPLYTEATLLGAMENAGNEVENDEARKAMSECGIGTPATRSSIIETLIIREYIRRDKKTLIPTDKGLAVYDIVKDKQIANAEMTGQWEFALARIENGEQQAETFNKNIREYTGQICKEMLHYVTINRFRNRLKDEINSIFTQVVLMLVDKGFITLDVEYIDGTKIESKANKYTFVWRKTVEKNRAKLQEKIRVLLGQIDDVISQDKASEANKIDFIPEMLTSLITELQDSLSAESKPIDKEQKKQQREKKKQINELEKHRDKLSEYDSRLEQIGERNSMSKTDPDATFMRMKEDAMNNGQTKPGYNLQISAENQFITDYALFPNPTDTLTLIPFFNSFLNRYGHLPSLAVADSGYGSEENYRFMDEVGIEAYVKYNRFHLEHRPRYKPNPFHHDCFHYNAAEDYYVCPMGQHMTRIGTSHSKTASGYQSENTRYRAQNCNGCPLRCLCYKAKGDRRIIEVNHQLNKYKRKACELLTSEEGLKHRGRRCIEPEAVFGQMKYDMAYKRFRHVGMDKVKMDFAFFAIAFNLRKLCSKIAKQTKNGGNNPQFGLFLRLYLILRLENRIIWKNPEKSSPFKFI